GDWELLSSARRAGRMARRVRQLDSCIRRFVQWRVAQLQTTRRVPSLFITRDAQNMWRGAPPRKL
ncbi:hypothetical protein A2U01_0085280, partial [Trifolium medium]|nr:hypothetical protein [Trifolium medium]